MKQRWVACQNHNFIKVNFAKCGSFLKSNLENAQRRLVSATAELDAIENKHLDATETRATQFPTLSIQKRLLFCITKVVWEINEDPSCSRLRGYVINPGKQDASVFNFETKNISKATSCRFLWDYIGASGISKKWKNLWRIWLFSEKFLFCALFLN